MPETGPLPWRKMWDFIAAIGEERALHGFITRTLSELSSLFPYDSAFAARTAAARVGV